jgi:hypothetical protein
LVQDRPAEPGATAPGYRLLAADKSPSSGDGSQIVTVELAHNLDMRMTIMREDTTIRYRTVAFSDPDETLLLPESIDSISIVTGGLQSTRRSQIYSDYKRFIGDSRVVERD